MNLKSIPSSPAKGKAKETTQWRTGWWDYYSLTEYPKRPLEWSSSSVIFTAHPTQPLVTARHFSSSKQFVIPSPTPVISSPGVYEPPSIISVASGDDWLFAYFPRRDNEFEGTGCLWNRGTRIDGWNVKEWWDFPLGGGAVTAAWLGGAREWKSDTAGAFIRLPPRGPRTPVSGPTVILVTQDHQIQLCYLRQYTSSLKMIKGSLLSPTFGLENLPLSFDTNQDEFGGIRQCIDATIGLFYNETSILVATRSRFIPPPSPDNQFVSIHFDGDTNASRPVDSALGCAWEACGERSKVAVCEVQLKFDGVNMGLATNPLPLLHRPNLSLTSLSFVCTPPSVDNLRSPSMTKKNEQERSKIYLATTYLNFNDFASIPKSELTLHAITRQPLIQNQGISNNFAWVCHLEATRSFNSEVLVFAMSSLIDFKDSVIYAGTMVPTGTLPTHSKAQDVTIGSIKALKIPDLSDIENWESSHIKSTFAKIGREMPLRVARSPNGLLACTLSSSTWPLQTAIHMLPVPTRKNSTLRGAFAQSLSLSLISAILGKRSTADITHLLALPSTPTSEVVDIFHHVLAVLDKNDNGLIHSSIWDILGTVIDVYRSKAQKARGEDEKKNLTSRWQAAHDMCSLAACAMAFQDCQEGDGYDHDTVWQLNGLSNWVIRFTERLMKECVLSRDTSQRSSQSDKDSQVDPEPAILLNLVHPYALQNFYSVVRQVKRYQVYLHSLSPSGEKAQIARAALIDLIQSSGVDFVALEPFLEDILRDTQKLEQNDCRRAFASCQLTPAMNVQLCQTLPKLTQSSILNKSMLFIKPSDLVDGVARLSIEPHKTDKTQDVVTKGVLVKHSSSSSCLRCGGISEVDNGLALSQHSPIRWRVWERMWTFRCVCGGPWLSTAVQL